MRAKVIISHPSYVGFYTVTTGFRRAAHLRFHVRVYSCAGSDHRESPIVCRSIRLSWCCESGRSTAADAEEGGNGCVATTCGAPSSPPSDDLVSEAANGDCSVPWTSRPPETGSNFRAPFKGSCFLGALPPGGLRAVCFVRAIFLSPNHRLLIAVATICGCNISWPKHFKINGREIEFQRFGLTVDSIQLLCGGGPPGILIFL